MHSLYVQNYALIEKLDIDFGSGFSTIIGEAGARKSTILGAIGLLLGQRVDMKPIGQRAAKCAIEARFEITGYGMRFFFGEDELEYEDEYILRREVYASGRSRAPINDTLVPLVQVKELDEQLIDAHSQHRNLLLNKEGSQLNVLNILMHDEEELSNYQSLHQEQKWVQQDLEDLIILAGQDKADEDYIRFQLGQLEDAQLAVGEQEELELEADTPSYAEKIKARLFHIGQVMNFDEGGLLSALKEYLDTMLGLQKIYPSAGELTERLESSYIELKDIFQKVSGKEKEIEFNPVCLGEANDRLNPVYTLQRKHCITMVDELLVLADDYAAKLVSITSSDEQIEELKARSEALHSRVKKQIAALAKLRTAAAREAEKQMAARLISLGMPNIRFRVEIGIRKEPGVYDADTVNFLFSANKNGALQNISSVASGRKIARVMPPVKIMITGAMKLPTTVFGEVDTRVPGEIADRMVSIMREMGNSNRQVISATYLPQTTARRHTHYKVYRQDNGAETNSRICRLADEERIEEIAHMLSGATLTGAALNNVKALLGIV